MCLCFPVQFIFSAEDATSHDLLILVVVFSHLVFDIFVFLVRFKVQEIWICFWVGKRIDSYFTGEIFVHCRDH